MNKSDPTRPLLQTSGTYSPDVMQGIHTKAETGIYEIRGYGTLRQRRWATFDDLTFLTASVGGCGPIDENNAIGLEIAAEKRNEEPIEIGGKEYELTWSKADTKITSSCLCQPSRM